jgi:hypothetical protein
MRRIKRKNNNIHRASGYIILACVFPLLRLKPYSTDKRKCHNDSLSHKPGNHRHTNGNSTWAQPHRDHQWKVKIRADPCGTPTLTGSKSIFTWESAKIKVTLKEWFAKKINTCIFSYIKGTQCCLPLPSCMEKLIAF